MTSRFKGGLKRLDSEFYNGICYVHWTMCIQDSKTGWLDQELHAAVRDALTHALAREFLCCPAYCLMPDHGHFLFVGYDRRSRQRMAVRWFREAWNERLPDGFQLQHQAYDHVLREEDRKRDAFSTVAFYILNNPVRTDLVEHWQAWPYSGALFPGYPHLDPRKDYYWVNFWKAYEKHFDT